MSCCRQGVSSKWRVRSPASVVLGISRTWSTPCTVSGRSLRSADLGDARVFPPAEETGGRSSTSAKLVSIRVFPIIEEMTRGLCLTWVKLGIVRLIQCLLFSSNGILCNRNYKGWVPYV